MSDLTTTKKIAVIPGDGIGKEVIPSAVEVLESVKLPLEFTYAEAGYETFQQQGSALPAETLAICEASDAILFGATGSPMEKVEGYFSPILALRNHFDLYANLRPAVGGEIKLLIVRENTEGLYSRRERVEDDGQTAITERVITAKASRRIVKLACELAMRRGKQLTLVHKANVLKESDGLFRRIGFEVAADYPELNVTEVLVDAMALYLVQDATRFDVIVTTNLFGDILSDLVAGLTGGLGIAPSANVGEKRPGVFEPVHGSAPDIAGKGLADPRAAILSACLMLENLGHVNAAALIKEMTYRNEHTGETRRTTQNIIEDIHRKMAGKKV